MFSLTLNDVLNVVRALLDIGLVWAVIFFGLRIVRNNSRTVQIFKGILFIFIVKGLAMLIGLTTINYIADMVLSWGVIVMVVIFQPEIRMLLEKLGKTSVLTRLAALSSNEKEHLVEELVKACTQMSASKTGALISLEQGQDLSDYIKTGTSMNSIVSSELLCSIFQYGTPLHDGAVIIRGVRIACAAAYFPPTTKELPTSYGARHRAAVGISEITDSITIIVSEETGTISIAEAGELKSYTSEELRDYLMTRYQIERREPRQELPQPAVEESAEQEPRTDDLIPTEAVVVKYHRRRKSGRRRRKGGEGSA
ncbi:MAG: diadenylate cyclase CdaA [Merdibacter sp.]|nr:diadenylate cyclase CdaA [Candidatus Merdibacter merdipullorum]